MIHIQIPGVPPTLNSTYIKTRGGGRALSPEGRKYKTETPAYIAQHYRGPLREFQPNVPVTMVVLFTFLRLENETWPGAAKARYKKLDVSNRLKLFEDCLKEAGGIDDSQNHMVAIGKDQGPVELTDAYIWVGDDGPLAALFSRLRSAS